MSKYYDEKCEQCDQGCHFHAFDKYPDGRPYEACRSAGYILHPEKGISKERCNDFLTEAQWQAKEAEKKRREKQYKSK